MSLIFDGAGSSGGGFTGGGSRRGGFTGGGGRRKPRKSAIEQAAIRAARNAANAGGINQASTGGITQSGGGGGGYSSGGGGGGGGSSVPAPKPPSLDDYIADNPLYVAQQNENSLLMDEFNDQTRFLRGEVRDDVSKRRDALARVLTDLGTENANDFAGRGLLRSGLSFQGQDKIDQQGEEQRLTIDEMLSDFIAQREQERLAQQATNRGALNNVIQQITDQYTKKYA